MGKEVSEVWDLLLIQALQGGMPFTEWKRNVGGRRDRFQWEACENAP